MLACELAAFWLTPGAWGAQKVTINLSLTQTPSSVSGVSTTTRNPGTIAIPTNFALYFQGLQTISAGSRQALALGGVTPLGFALLHNADNVNYVSIYSDAAVATEFARLYPGDWALIPLGPNATPYAQANTAAVNLESYLTAR